ncbi:type II secretion system protein [Campylobacter sp. CCUG 57310]|uniref:type II secretion system protein n=1 Tax=Campylobacter sp. CCUG 57310 TaxID=2517362 RepID=UPI0015665276|nr:prepilin-type N-terminal cleavage/methylation domain-containing protein [Campylobacter sp. CCUG 57310]QKF91956.1 type II secretion/transformation system, G protein [Campylobacter sp. CCUG 57310]
MRKGFTMIELIFVIVILGILAAVAIPRLAATRDDAEISKTATNITTVLGDLTSYYTSQGQFADNFPAMTAVSVPVKAKSNDCLLITQPATDAQELSVEIKEDGLCAQVWALPSLKEVKKSITDNNSKIKVGGQGVKYQ